MFSRLLINCWAFVGFCIVYDVKVNSSFNRPRKPIGGVELQLCAFFNLGAIRSGWLTSRLGRFIPWKDTVPIVRGLVGPRAGLDRWGKSLP